MSADSDGRGQGQYRRAASSPLAQGNRAGTPGRQKPHRRKDAPRSQARPARGDAGRMSAQPQGDRRRGYRDGARGRDAQRYGSRPAPARGSRPQGAAPQPQNTPRNRNNVRARGGSLSRPALYARGAHRGRRSGLPGWIPLAAGVAGAAAVIAVVVAIVRAAMPAEPVDPFAASLQQAYSDGMGSVTATAASAVSQVQGLSDDEVTAYFSQVDGAQEELADAVAAIEDDGYSVGYVIQDLSGGGSLSYNADTTFYSASSIKAPFCVSLLRAHGEEVRAYYGNAVEACLVNSDNDAYGSLWGIYPSESFLQNFAAEAGAAYEEDGWYAFLTPNDLAKMWALSAAWLSSGDEVAQWAGSLMGNSLNSLVDDVAGEDGAVTTWSKAGWLLDGSEYDTTVDAGVVCADYGSYVIVVVTNKGQDFDAVRSVMEPLVETWELQRGDALVTVSVDVAGESVETGDAAGADA